MSLRIRSSIRKEPELAARVLLSHRREWNDDDHSYPDTGREDQLLISRTPLITRFFRSLLRSPLFFCYCFRYLVVLLVYLMNLIKSISKYLHEKTSSELRLWHLNRLDGLHEMFAVNEQSSVALHVVQLDLT